MEQWTDEALVRAAQGGDRQAFGVLIDRHRAMLHRLIARRVGDAAWTGDIVQEAVLQAYLSLSTLRDETRFRAWLCGIALNVWRAQARRDRLTLSLDVLVSDERRELSSGDLTPEDIAERIEIRRRVLAAVAQLSRANREAVEAFYLYGCDLRETAAMLDISTGAVKARLHKARLHLRELLGQDMPSYRTEELEGDTAMLPIQIADVLMKEIAHGDNREVRQYQLVMMHEASRRAFCIWIGEAEGLAISLRLNETEQQRPMTHAFAARLLDATRATVESVTINAIKDDVFYATVKLSSGSGAQEIDARPSDAIALALQVGTPLFASQEVLDSAGFDVPEGYRTERRGLAEIMAMFEKWTQESTAYLEQQRAQRTFEEEMDAEQKRILEVAFGVK